MAEYFILCLNWSNYSLGHRNYVKLRAPIQIPPVTLKEPFPPCEIGAPLML